MYGLSVIKMLFLIKLATSGLIIYFINSYKKKEFYYYYNLGVSKKMLWSVSLMLDSVLFSIALLLISQIK